jgi:hypothetical protein
MMSVVASDRSLFIAGTWEEAEGPPIDVVNPATEDRLASVPSASHAQVEAALDAARAAQFAWAELPPIQRSAHLRAIADIIEEHSDDIARLVVLEVGKPMKQALGEVAWSVAYTRYMAEWDRRIEGEIVPKRGRWREARVEEGGADCEAPCARVPDALDALVPVDASGRHDGDEACCNDGLQQPIRVTVVAVGEEVHPVNLSGTEMRCVCRDAFDCSFEDARVAGDLADEG